ncbi:MAG TPA: carbohydrate-binding domain-containing protein, partial [Terriglobales bacterium]|nr:carbohydrate-binding domain-containing protein [Terriglobales bacterium]
MSMTNRASRIASCLVAAALLFGLYGCTKTPAAIEPSADGTQIVLSDAGVTVDGSAASEDTSSAVYVGADIVYYEAGHDAQYGEGTEADAHTAEEAAANTVVTITQPGTYVLSGELSAGQIAVDLGEGAKEDPEAKVELVLNGVDITCGVAPAVIFYNVYETGSTEEAGAVVTLADGSANVVGGAYVAKIYEEGTTDKLHKYDGAFYAKMSMSIGGSGALEINAENEGLDSEMHLTINSGDIRITSANDGINTNEDGVSVTTINGGTLWIDAGSGSEGDGIDSNGALVINGGMVLSFANPTSGDGGLDADGDITINGGTVLAVGSRNDEVSENSTQGVMQLNLNTALEKGDVISLKDADGNVIYTETADKGGRSVILSCPELTEGETYALYINDVQQQYTGTGAGGMGGGQRPQGGGFTPPENAEKPAQGAAPENAEKPADGTMPEAPQGGAAPETPEGTAPEAGEQPEDAGDAAEGESNETAQGPGQRPQGGGPGGQGGPGGAGGQGDMTIGDFMTGEPSTEFTLTTLVSTFSGVSAA